MGQNIKISVNLFTIIVLSMLPLFLGKLWDSDLDATLKVTNNGWVYLLLALISLISNGWMIITDDSVNTKQRKKLNTELSDIKKALKDKGLFYNSSTNEVKQVNISSGNAISIQGTEVSNINISGVNDGRTLDIKLIDTDLLKKVKEIASTNNIVDNGVFLAYINGTEGEKYLIHIHSILIKGGYSVLGTGVSERDNKEDKDRITVTIYRGKICVIVGGNSKGM